MLLFTATMPTVQADINSGDQVILYEGMDVIIDCYCA